MQAFKMIGGKPSKNTKTKDTNKFIIRRYFKLMPQSNQNW